ncbi:MAK10-like protein [Tanacetum coccineum]|uniref:MAK10-like protein n=1 Tax=Tanacetum coccineum TaxID=301880 RepID=A0ABQ4XG99_9ASTR
MPDRRLLELEDQIRYLLKGSMTTPETSSTYVPQAYAKEKVLVREEARLITKNVNAISLVKMKKENNTGNNKEEITGEGIEELVEMPRSQPIGYYLIHEINKELIEGLIGNQRIDEDMLVEIAGYVYPVDFVIFEIKEDKKKPFILGTPFLTTTKAEIRFDKGTISLKSGKNKINFFKIPESPRRVEEETENDINLVSPTNAVSRLILEWEERIKLHQEREIKFNQWRSKVFNDRRSALVNEGCEVSDEEGVT